MKPAKEPANAAAGIAPAGDAEDFAGCLARTNPSAAALERLQAQPDESPIIMLNLLRFRPRGDMRLYAQYADAAGPEIEKSGSSVACFGKVLSDLEKDPDVDGGFHGNWDAVVMIAYQRRHAYLQLQQNKAYQLAIPYRVAGTQRRQLYVLADDDSLCAGHHSIAELARTRRQVDSSPDSVLCLQLLNFKTDNGRARFGEYLDSSANARVVVGAEILLSVRAELPVLSEQYWEHCLLTRFPTRQAMLGFFDSPAYRDQQSILQSAIASECRLAIGQTPLPTAD